MTTLTADDALRLAAELVEWLTTPDASRATVNFWEGRSMSSAKYQDQGFTPLGVAGDVNLGLSTRLRDEVPIWCDPHMTDLLAASAAVFPAEEIRTDPQLPSTGMMVFAKPLPVEWTFTELGGDWSPVDGARTESRSAQIQAVTWDLLKGDTFFLASGWKIAKPAVVDVPGHGKARLRTLWPSALNEIWYRAPQPDQAPTHQDGPILRLLNTFAGLTRTPIVTDTTQEASAKATRTAKRARLHEPRIRRLYRLFPNEGVAMDGRVDARVGVEAFR